MAVFSFFLGQLVAQATPNPVSVSPSSGAGQIQTFTLTYNDTMGANSLTGVSLLINTLVDGRSSCWMTYEPPNNLIWLASDDISGWTSGKPGSQTTLSNDQCSVDLSHASVSISGSLLTLQATITFTNQFAGTKSLYMTAADNTGSPNFTAQGTFSVTAASLSGMSVAPASGSGINQTFTFTFGDTSGFGDLEWVNVLIPSPSVQGSCWLAYYVPGRVVSLASDDSSTWPAASLGSSQTLQNSQCALSVANSTASGSGNLLTLQLNLTFLPAFEGYKTIYGRAQSVSGLVAGYAAVGTWEISTPVSINSSAISAPAPTGAHWLDAGLFGTLAQSEGYSFAVAAVNPSDTVTLTQTLAAAQASGMQLIIGAYPAPYTLQANNTWTISPAGIAFLQTLAANASIVKAVYVFNEPYWIDQTTGQSNSCGVLSAAQLRTLRTTIQSVWPQAKIYQDIGDPQSWTPGGSSWNSCVGSKYSDQTGIADYVGIWSYPFTASGYNRQPSLDFAYQASRYVLNSMSPAQPVFLAQSFACAGCSLMMPTASQIQDWNCSVRSSLAPGSLISWYVWRQSPLYSDFLANYPSYWPLTTSAACTNYTSQP